MGLLGDHHVVIKIFDYDKGLPRVRSFTVYTVYNTLSAHDSEKSANICQFITRAVIVILISFLHHSIERKINYSSSDFCIVTTIQYKITIKSALLPVQKM